MPHSHLSKRFKRTLGIGIVAAIVLVAAGAALAFLLVFCIEGTCGGHALVTTTTWTWDGHTWSSGLRQQGVGGFDDFSNSSNLANDSSTGQLVLVGSGSNIDETSTWEWSSHGWSSAGSTAISSGSLVYDGSSQKLLMVNDSAAYSWTRNAWVKVDSMSGPGDIPVAPEPLVYDGQLSSVVTIDRNCNLGSTTTTFALQGGSWIPLSNGTLTSWGDLAYDASRSQLVLVGDDHCGANGSGNCPAWTWIFDGSKWTRLALTTTPLVNLSQPGCYLYNLKMNRIVYDPDLQEVLFLGARQLWAWDGRGWSVTSTSLPSDMDSARSEIVFEDRLHELVAVSTTITTARQFIA